VEKKKRKTLYSGNRTCKKKMLDGGISGAEDWTAAITGRLSKTPFRLRQSPKPSNFTMGSKEGHGAKTRLWGGEKKTGTDY